MPDIEVLTRALERERKARKQAESLLEEKTREIYQTNEELRSTLFAFGEQSERTRAIVETAAEGILTYNDQGMIDSANSAAARIFGYSIPELMDLTASQLMPHSDIFHSSVDVLGKRRDGSVVPLDIAVSETSIGERGLFTAIVRDISHRKELERQLAHAQKMESVGQLAAGIAHEINTPMQYVGDNLHFMEESFSALVSMILVYQQIEEKISDNPDLASLIEEARRISANADVPFLLEEMPNALRQSIEGADRVSRIVQAMREFSHPGVKDKIEVDLQKAIESTITVSRHEWKLVADVVTDFDPELPKVWCLAGEINQVILNLVVNAAHAIANKPDRKGRGQITIRTRRSAPWAEIHVQDTGTGIPPEIRDRIFDPFFTTKPLGVGTGQGLAIAYSAVVEKHKGTIHFESECGQGTTFIVRLPLEPLAATSRQRVA